MKIILLVCSTICLISAMSGEIFMNEHKDTLEKLADAYLKENSPEMIVRARQTREDFEGADIINRGFERMMQLVNVLGQVDNFISDRTKNIVRKLNAAYDVDDNDYYRKFHSRECSSSEDTDISAKESRIQIRIDSASVSFGYKFTAFDLNRLE